jgi:hypothetical protein
MAPQKLPLEITWTEDQLNYLKSKKSQNKGWKLNWKKSSKWQPTLPNTKTDLNHWTTKVRQTSNIQPMFGLPVKITSSRSKSTTK